MKRDSIRSFAQHLHVVRQVSGDDIRKGADCEAIVAGNAAARPCLGWHISEKRDGGEADAAELLDVGGPGDCVRLRAGCRDVLVVAGQGTLKAVRKPEGAESDGALGVGDMVQQLADAPLFRRVAIKRFFFRDACEKCWRLFQLTLDCGNGIVAGHLVDVGEIVGRGFGRLWTSDHVSHFTAVQLLVGLVQFDARSQLRVHFD